MIVEKKQSNVKLTGVLLRWLALGLLFASTHALAQTGGTVTYVYTDPQGTPLAETDASGSITATFDYTPYGTYAPNGTSTPGPNPNGPGYTGHVNDPETNLVYMQARYYDPATGHFLSTDPVAPSAGNAFGFNRYVYAGNNPIMHIDPDGRAFGLDDIAGIVVGGIVGVGVEAVKDLVTGEPMTRASAAGAFAGGAVTGDGIVNIPETLGGSMVLAGMTRGAVVGAVSNGTQQIVDHEQNGKSYSAKDLVVSTVAGTVTGGLISKVGTLNVAGVTTGRGSMAAVAKAVKTRITNGNASTMSGKTIVKDVISQQTGDAGKTIVGGEIDTARAKACQQSGCGG